MILRSYNHNSLDDGFASVRIFKIMTAIFMTAIASKYNPKILPAFGVFLAVAYPIFLALWHDISRSYTITPDADLVYISEALRYVEGLPQISFGHPAYTYSIGLGVGLQLLSLFGLVPEPSHSIAVQTQDIDAYFQSLTVGARWLTTITCSFFVGFIIWATKRLTSNLPLAVLAGLFFATTQGLAALNVILRAELLSAIGLIAAYFFLRIADQTRRKEQLFYLFLAGFATMVSLESKIQSIIPFLGIPILILAHEQHKSSYLVSHKFERLIAPLLFSVAAIIPMFVLLYFSVFHGTFGSVSSAYQGLILAYVIGSIFAYGYLRDIPYFGQLTGAVALALGLALGVYLLFIWHSHKNLDQLVHFVEHMMKFTNLQGAHSLNVAYITDKIGIVFERRFNGHLLPIHALEFSAILLAAVLGYKGYWRKSLLVILFLGLSLSIEIAFGLRGFPERYFIYTEIWVIIAVLVVGVEFYQAMTLRTRALCLLCLAFVVGWNVNLGLRASVVPKQQETYVCYQARAYMVPELSIRFRHYCD